MEEEKLLPCPFCGNAAEVMPQGKNYRVFCVYAFCNIQPHLLLEWETKDSAIKAWNTRTPSVTVDMEKRLQEAFSMGWNSCMLTEDRGGVNRHIKFIMFLERYRSAIKDPSAIKEG